MTLGRSWPRCDALRRNACGRHWRRADDRSTRIIELTRALKQTGLHITIETAGTVYRSRSHAI